MDTIRVLIVDDHPLFRQDVRLFLQTADTIELVGELDDGTKLVEHLGHYPAHVLLLDLQMPRTDGLDVLQTLQEHVVALKVLILTSFGGWERVDKDLQLGAAGYVMKDAPLEELVAAIQAAAAWRHGLSCT